MLSGTLNSNFGIPGGFMEISTRLLAVMAEFMTIPAETEGKKIRDVFNRISDTHGINSFATIADGHVHMSSKKSATNYQVMRDRLVLSYEQCDNGLSYYAAMIKDFIENYSKATGVNLFLVHNIGIRKLVNMGSVDGRDYLIKKVFSMTDANLKPFARPLHVMGARIFFPAMEGGDMTSYEVKFESSMEDHKTLFIENKGTFPAAIDMRKPFDIGADIVKTDDFINNNLMQFLTQFSQGGA
jgi:hypothetical protein